MLNVFAGFFLSLFQTHHCRVSWCDIFVTAYQSCNASLLEAVIISDTRTGLWCYWITWESGRGSAWCFYWRLFACRWLINIKQLFHCKHPRWIQVAVEHMLCLRAGTRIWIPHWEEDARGYIRNQQSSNLWKWINAALFFFFFSFLTKQLNK